AQEPVTVVAGRVVELPDGRPIGFASVVVEDTESRETLSGTYSGEDGRFRIEGLRPGTYTIRITFPGFYEATADVTISPLNSSYDLGEVRLPRVEGVREEITVTADALRARAEGLDTQLVRLGDGPAPAT